ncbi:MAG: hypothetical protein NTZ63_06640 [Candidatus Omnitrophica bacterium]|nr:hypothetical protein [Candidatus Omnitrophota bacterium]
MDKKRIQIIITIFLGIVMIFLWINSIKTVSKKVSANKAVVQASKVVAPAPVVAQVQPVKAKEVSDWLRDPFSGKSYVKVHKEDSNPRALDLTGIMWDTNKPVALVNGRVVGIGGTVVGNTVVDIKPDRVVFNDGENDFEIKIK